MSEIVHVIGLYILLPIWLSFVAAIAAYSVTLGVIWACRAEGVKLNNFLRLYLEVPMAVTHLMNVTANKIEKAKD